MATQTVVSNADKLTNFAIDKMQHLIDAASVTLPKATKLALEAISVNCTLNVIDWIMGFIVFSIVLYIGQRILRYGVNRYNNRNDKYSEEGVGSAVAGGITTVIAGIGVIAFLCMIPYWSFIGMFHPDLFVVHAAIAKLL